VGGGAWPILVGGVTSSTGKNVIAGVGSAAAMFNTAVEEFKTKPELAEDFGKLTTQMLEVNKSIMFVDAAYQLGYLPNSLQPSGRRIMLSQYIFNGELPQDQPAVIQEQIAKMGDYIYRNKNCYDTGKLPTEPNPFADQIRFEKEMANKPQNNNAPRNYEFHQN